MSHIVKIICPVQHKLHYYSFIDNVQLYYSIIDKWIKQEKEYGKEKIKSKDGKISFRIKKPLIINGENYYFGSKYGLTYRKDENDYKRNFDYSFKLESKDKLKKLYILLKPELENSFYGKHKTYGDYKPYTNKKDLGVELEINTTYFEFEDTQKILKQIFEYFNISKFFSYQNKDKGLIRQCEFHIRYEDKKEKDVANTLNDLDRVIGLSTDEYTKITRTKEGNKYKLYSLRSNKFDELGFFNNNSKWRFAVKTYRLKEDSGLTKYHSIRHPKLEIFMDEQKKDEYLKLSYPRLNDFYKLKNSMYDILAHIIYWSNLEDSQLVGDNYFDPEKEIEFEFIEKTNLKEKLKQLVECVKPEIRKEVSKLDSVRDYLNHLVKEGQATYKSLQEYTGFGYDWIRRLTDKLEEKEIIQRIKSDSNIIIFKNKYTSDITKAILQVINFTYDEDNENEKRKEERKEKRERRKKHIFDKFEISEKALNWLVENKEIPYRNGGLYELVNYEIIEPNQELKIGGLNDG